MNKPLSERLEAAMHWYDNYGELPSDGEIDGFDLMREAAALARRVEGAHERTVVQDREGFLYVGAMASGLDFGQRVALVPVEGGA